MAAALAPNRRPQPDWNLGSWLQAAELLEGAAASAELHPCTSGTHAMWIPRGAHGKQMLLAAGRTYSSETAGVA